MAAAYGVALELGRDPDGLERACETLGSARPTAVNLAHAVRRVQAAVMARRPGEPPRGRSRRPGRSRPRRRPRAPRMATHGADLLAGGRRILTHCNTGALAAPGRGTALAVMAELADRGGLELVIAAESRPLLQGARLTVYELRRLGIAHELIVDGAAAGLIASGGFDAVLVGCDRVAANGDVANKVGTYAHALAAAAAGIPFVVAGPTSTIDPGCQSGAEIEIEQRDEAEVSAVRTGPDGRGRELTLAGTRCRNPAFDITPAALVTALVTERGVPGRPKASSVHAPRTAGARVAQSRSPLAPIAPGARRSAANRRSPRRR